MTISEKNLTQNITKPINTELTRERLRRLSLWGLLANYDEIADAEWLLRIVEYEEAERSIRSLQRRLSSARLGRFKPMADFQWTWPSQIDRELVEELFTLNFINEGVNAIFLGPNGVGKSTVAQNLAHKAIIHGHTVRFTTASDMLNDLAAQDNEQSLSRRLKRYTKPKLLVIDEVGYLSYDVRYADLLFEVVTRRYNEELAIVLTTNTPFAQWPETFPNASCVVTLVDRLIHRSEIVTIEGGSYRLHEAKERASRRAKKKKTTTKRSSAKTKRAGAS